MSPMFRSLAPLLAAGLLMAAQGCGMTAPPPKPGGLAVGDQAYDFNLADSTGHRMRLSDLQEGWYTVLIFYRGHWCSACQNQLLDMKENVKRLAQDRIALAFISVDRPEESAEFNAQWRLPFPLLSDPRLEVIDAYGLRHPKGHEGKDISKPCTLILDPKKRIRFKHVGVSPVDRPSVGEILEIVRKIEREDGVKAKLGISN